MNCFSKAMVAVAGHHVDASTQPEEIGGLSKIGISICFASALAALQFAIAGWFLADGFMGDARVAFAMVLGLIGASIVLIVDRNFIYAADTSAQSHGYLSYAYLGVRIFLIVVISSLSSQFTLPLLLKSELEIHVQDLRDERYDTAKERYVNKYELPEKVRSERETAQQITKVKSSLNNLPQDIIHQKLASEQCLREYKKKINASIGPDIDDDEVANLYARDKTQCEQLEIAYKEAYKVYVAPRQAELALIQASHQHLEADVKQAQGALKGDLEKADQNNLQYLNASSADVLWSLIRHNPGARMKYLMITLVQLILELMPLLLKTLLGRSALGIRIALRTQHLNESLEVSGHSYALGQIGRVFERNTAMYQNQKADLTHQLSIEDLKAQLQRLKAETRSHRFNWGFTRQEQKTPNPFKETMQSVPLQGVNVKKETDQDREGMRSFESEGLNKGLYAI